MSPPADRLPEHYPWATPAEAGSLEFGVFRPHPDPLSIERPELRPVIAVGSNASHDVLAAKLPRETCVPLVAATVHDIAIGHSAHVSLAGYIAAAPFHQPGARTRVVVTWLDPTALAALDASEPNYDRIGVADIGGLLEMHGRPRDADIYSSRHGVIRIEETLALMPQGELFTRLARIPELTGLLRGPPGEVCSRLAADPRACEQVRLALSVRARAPQRTGAGRRP